MRILALTKPAEFFNLGVDIDNYKYNVEFDQYLVNDRTHLVISDVEIYGSVVEEASSMIGNISKATDGLTTASLTIQTVSGRLESALAPIVNLESSLSNANLTIQSSTKAMSEMRDSMATALSSLSAFSEGTDLIGKTSVAVETASTRLMAQVAAAGKALGATDDRLDNALISASEIADRLANVASSTETHEPHLATMARIAQSLSDTAHSIHLTVQEVKAATAMFEQLNREIADGLRAN
jgi:chromosome segregation ATPase